MMIDRRDITRPDGRRRRHILTTIGIFIGFAAVAALVRFGPDRIPREGSAVRAVALVGGALAVLGESAPTGWSLLDAVARAGAVAVVAVGAGRAGPWRVAWAVGLAAAGVAVGASSIAPAATIAFGGVLALIASARSHRVVQAACGSAGALVLFDLHWPVATGASTALTVAALAPLAVAGLGAAHDAKRTAVRATIGAAVAFAAAGAAAGLAAAGLAKSDIDRGVRAARDGLAALERDDRPTATASLGEAAAAFADADDVLRAPWARPAFAVPIVAQQIRAVSTLASAGGGLAETAVETLRVADPSTIRPVGGQIDLAAVRRLRAPLEEVDRIVRHARRNLAQTDSPWLLAPVADRHDELGERLRRTAEQSSVAARAARVAPDLLGGAGPRRYLLAVYTPAESRGGGGFMGNFGELTADNGKLALARFGRISDLTRGGPDPAGRTITGHADYRANWGSLKPQQYWGLINFTNDFPTAASVMRQLYPQSGGARVDGVIAVDPDAFAALLRLTGPLTVEGWPEPLTPDNARRVLLHDQYLNFGNDDRVDFLGEASRRLFDQLTSGQLPGVGAVADSLGPVVRGRHLQLESADPDEQSLFASLGASGAVGPFDGDAIGFTGQNYGGNKIDWFLHRKATYSARWDPGTGRVDSALTLELRNDAPATGLPHAVIGWGGDEILNQLPVADGENLMLVSVYSALPVRDFAVDGKPTRATRRREHGRYVTRFYVRVPPASTATATLRFTGSISSGRDYDLDVMRQPMVNSDRLDVAVDLAEGWKVGETTGLSASGPASAELSRSLDEPVTASMRACPTSRLALERARGSC